MAWTLVGNIKGPVGSTGAVGATGPTGGFGIATPTVSTRTLNTTFTPSATKLVAVKYPITITVAATVIAGQTATVELRCDTSSPPTTVRDIITRTVGSGLVFSFTTVDYLGFDVPAGFNVRLVSSGTGTITLGSAQTETELA